MKIAFCLHKYFPYGGQQRDFRRIALACQQRGHQIVVYTFEWQGEICPGFDIVLVPKQGRSNHHRNHNFSQWVRHHRQQHPVDLLVGFNKMPGLDVYFAADVCYAEKTAREKGWLYKLTPRYRSYIQAESAVFAPSATTEILALTTQQISQFSAHYHTPPGRFHLLAPGIDRPEDTLDRREEFRTQTREKLGIKDLLLLQVGSDFRRKGVARSLAALAALPEEVKTRIQFWIVGADKPDAFQKLARQYGIAHQVFFDKGRDDIPQLMAAADLLLHPAHQEAAGIVLIEALAAALPVICTEVCGYAPYLAQAKSCMLLTEPYSQQQFNQALADTLQQPERLQQWSEAAKAYCQQHDLYRLPEQAADIIEKRASDAAIETTL